MCLKGVHRCYICCLQVAPASDSCGSAPDTGLEAEQWRDFCASVLRDILIRKQRAPFGALFYVAHLPICFEPEQPSGDEGDNFCNRLQELSGLTVLVAGLTWLR